MKFKLIAVVCLAAAAKLHAQNLLVNGDFGTGDFTGWSASGHVGVTQGEGEQNSTYSAVFNSGESAPNGVVSQTFSTVIGQTYDLTFQYGDFITAGGATQKLDVDVLGASTLLDTSVTSPPGGAYPTPLGDYSLVFTANSASTVLTFTDDAANDTISQDGVLHDVSVSAPDSGSSFALMTGAMAMVGGLSRKLRRFAKI